MGGRGVEGGRDGQIEGERKTGRRMERPRQTARQTDKARENNIGWRLTEKGRPDKETDKKEYKYS